MNPSVLNLIVSVGLGQKTRVDDSLRGTKGLVPSKCDIQRIDGAIRMCASDLHPLGPSPQVWNWGAGIWREVADGSWTPNLPGSGIIRLGRLKPTAVHYDPDQKEILRSSESVKYRRTS